MEVMMAKWLVCQKQKGEGCDYTIGCGMRYDVVEAESLDAAIEQTIWPEGRDECSALMYGDGEAIIEILVVPWQEVRMVNVAKRLVEIEEREAVMQEAEAEYVEYLRLKEKFGC